MCIRDSAWTEEELEIYEYWQIRDAGDRYKIQEEFEKGVEQGKLEVARNLKLAGIAPEIIVQSTGLRREEIDNI